MGIEGLDLLRHLYEGTDEDAQQRLAEVRRLLDDEAFASTQSTTETDPITGYRSSAGSYDEPGNPIIELEQSIVWGMIESPAPGRALDAACGTGRQRGG